MKQGTTTLRTFTHDAAGNITADNRAGSTYNYTISAAGRISQVKLGTQIRADYLYDGKSRLAQSIRQNVTNAGTTRYIHDANDRIIAEVSATGAAIREYVWLDDLPIAVLDGSVNQANPSLFWVHADHLNRPVMMTDATRAVVWRAFYEPFGAVHSITGPAANDNRFPGQLFQLETGLAYNRHRHYDATIGRYTQPDPLGLQTLLSDGPSVYGYVGQSPLMNVDETGQWWWLARPIIGAIAGTLADAAIQYATSECGISWSTAFLRGGMIGAGFGYKPGTQLRFTPRDRNPHNFRWLGNRDHAQLDTWVKGAKGTHSSLRIPHGPVRNWHNKP